MSMLLGTMETTMKNDLYTVRRGDDWYECHKRYKRAGKVYKFLNNVLDKFINWVLKNKVVNKILCFVISSFMDKNSAYLEKRSTMDEVMVKLTNKFDISGRLVTAIIYSNEVMGTDWPKNDGGYIEWPYSWSELIFNLKKVPKNELPLYISGKYITVEFENMIRNL
jgi:hypothetical protein